MCNLSYPGGSNLQSFDRLKHYLNCNQHELPRIVAIFFFKTEFFREIFHYGNLELTSELHHGYTQVKNNWSNYIYYKLSDLSQQWGFENPISIVGGCSDALILPKEPPGIHVVCQSWTNLIINNEHLVNKPVLTEYINGWVDPFLDLIKPQCSNADLAELTDDIALGNKRIDLMYKHPHYFGPDPIHPNRHSHKILFDFLINKMEL